MAFARDTVVDPRKDQDQVNEGIMKLDQDLSSAYTHLNTLQSSVASKINLNEKGAVSGVCPLGADTLISLTYIPDIPTSKLPASLVTPIGMVRMWPLFTPPSGHLECNGAELSTETYSELFAVIGYLYGGSGSKFNLPDYRGLFIRGWSHGSGVDPNASTRTNRGDGTIGDNIGTKQLDTFKLHAHSVGSYTAVVSYPGNEVSGPVGGANVATTYTGGDETRPINANMMFCIKYQ